MKWNVQITDVDTEDEVRYRRNVSKAFVDNFIDQFCMSLRMYRVVEDFDTTDTRRNMVVEGRMNTDHSYIRQFSIEAWSVETEKN